MQVKTFLRFDHLKLHSNFKATTKMIDELKKYDERYCANLSHGEENAKVIFEYIEKGSNLILSAPHATCSFVKKKEKVADLFTGAIVEYLGMKNNISTLIRTKYTPYKALISDYIFENGLENHYFLDIHGFNQDIGYDICIGIGDCRPNDCPYLKDILKIAEKYHLKAIINHPNYTGMIGLTGRYQMACGKPNVIQLELKRYLRDFYNHAEEVENITIPFLTNIINLYQKESN